MILISGCAATVSGGGEELELVPAQQHRTAGGGGLEWQLLGQARQPEERSEDWQELEEEQEQQRLLLQQLRLLLLRRPCELKPLRKTVELS